MSIGKLARGVGVKVVTIRYYEQIGLLPPPARTANNYRVYNEEHARRLRFIRRCRDLGFSLHQVRDLCRLSAENATACVEVCRLAERHLQAIESKLIALHRLAAELRRISATCNGDNSTSGCRIIKALSLTA